MTSAAPTWTAEPFVPPTTDLDRLAEASHGCTGCPLFQDTTQTVFGHGAPDASLVLVGEQPGDQEDTAGEPFVGPAGRVLARCLERAGIQADRVYLTNAVKHFKHEVRGKRRIHKKPGTAEILACRPWLEAELAAVPGTPVVALGAVAARSLLGRTVPVAGMRGQDLHVGDRPLIVTYHPSSVLRAEDDATLREQDLVDDLTAAWALATG